MDFCLINTKGNNSPSLKPLSRSLNDQLPNLALAASPLYLLFSQPIDVEAQSHPDLECTRASVLMKGEVGERKLKRARRTHCNEWKHTASWLMALKLHSHKRINSLGHII